MNDPMDGAARRLRRSLSDAPPVAELRRRARKRTLVRRVVLAGGAVAVALGVLTVTEVSNRSENDQVEFRTAPPTKPVTVGTVIFPDSRPPNDLSAMAAEIDASVSADHRLSTAHLGRDSVRVELKAGRDQIAEALINRYGSAVEVRIGGYSWPPSDLPSACLGQAGPGSGDPATVTAKLVLARMSVAFGEDIFGQVTVRNDSSAAIRLQIGGGISDGLLLASDGSVAGTYVGGHDLKAEILTVEAGTESPPLPARIGITSCEPDLGTAVQPGVYTARVDLRLADGRRLSTQDARVEIGQVR